MGNKKYNFHIPIKSLKGSIISNPDGETAMLHEALANKVIMIGGESKEVRAEITNLALKILNEKAIELKEKEIKWIEMAVQSLPTLFSRMVDEVLSE